MPKRHHIAAILMAGFLFLATSPVLGQDLLTQPYILNISIDGGWDPTMVFDPKTGVPTVAGEAAATTRVSSSGITHVSHPDRPAVDTFFDNFGASCAIVNGLSTRSLNNKEPFERVYSSIVASNSVQADWLSFYALITGAGLPYPMISMDQPTLSASCLNGCRYIDTNRLDSYLSPVSGASNITVGLRDLMMNFALSSLQARTYSIGPNGIDFHKLFAMTDAIAKDAALRTHLKEVHDNIVLDPPDEDFVRNAKIMLDFFRLGYSKVANIRYGGEGEWDTQSQHFAKANALYQSLFTDLNTIFVFARDTAVLPNLLVTLTSNLGRSPQLNAAGGKDRWQFTSSLLCGNGIAGATVVGATDDYLRGIPLNPLFGTADGTNDVTLNFKNIAAALYLKYGLPYENYTGQLPLSPILGP